MALKRLSGKVEILDLEGSQIYAIKPDKSTWDEYMDSTYSTGPDGQVKVNTTNGIRRLYTLCVKKVTNVEVEEEGVMRLVPEITETGKIVDFLSHISDPVAGKKIDGWLLGLGDLSKAEAKNSNGELDASSQSPSPLTPTTAPSVS
jgi:hypothetical protein